MRIIFLTILFFSKLILSYGQKPQPTFFEGGVLNRDGNWTIVFQDDFNGTSLDTGKWYTYYPYGPRGSDLCSFCRTHDTVVSQQIYLDKNLIINNGNLEIHTLNEQTKWMGFTSDFSTGLVYSKPTFNTYSKFEMRCKIPEGTIFWPAFWMFGWSTEIDVFEFMSNNTRDIYFNIHKWIDGKSINKSKKYKGPDYALDFHTYAVEYEPNFVNYLIDDKLVHRIPKYVKKNGRYIKKSKLNKGNYYLNPAYPNHGDPLAVIAGNAVSTQRARDSKEFAKTKFPAIMYIDYIRVSQKMLP